MRLAIFSSAASAERTPLDSVIPIDVAQGGPCTVGSQMGQGITWSDVEVNVGAAVA